MKTRLATILTLCIALFFTQATPLLADANTAIDFSWNETTPQNNDWKPLPAGQKTFFPNPSGGAPKPLWLRYRINHVTESDPVLFLNWVDDAFTVFHNGEPIYSWGELDSVGKPLFRGRPWHMIPLLPQAGEQTITLRVLSSSAHIGVMGSPRVSARATIVSDMWIREIDKICVAWQAIFLGIVGILLGLRKKIRGDLIYAGAFSTLLGIWIQSTAWTQTKQFIWNNPLGWFYLDVYSLLLILIPMSLFLREILGRHGRWYNIAIPIITVMSALGITVSALGWMDILTTLGSFQLFYFAFAALTIPTMTIACLKGNREARLFAVGLAAMAILATHDVALDLRLIDGDRQISYWGGLIAVATMIAILQKRFADTHTNMTQYRKHLELILASTRQMSISETEIQSILIFFVELGNAGILSPQSRLVIIPDGSILPLNQSTVLTDAAAFNTTMSHEPLRHEQRTPSSIVHEIALRQNQGNRPQYTSIELTPIESSVAETHTPEKRRPEKKPPKTRLSINPGELQISLAAHEKYLLHLVFDVEPTRSFSTEEMNFVHTLAESLSIVILGLELAAQRRGEKARRMEQERKHLIAQISLAAHLSDKLNSPLLVLDNAMSRIRRSIDDRDFSTDNRDNSLLLAKLVEMLGDAVKKIKEVSKKLSDLREKGRNIESTRALNTAELEAKLSDTGELEASVWHDEKPKP